MRDQFGTARTAIFHVLIKMGFLNRIPIKKIWDPCAGEGRIARVLRECGYEVVESDVDPKYFGESVNFLQSSVPPGVDFLCENFPFSIKKECVNHAIKLGIPFAVLVPSSASDWLTSAVHDKGCEKIWPRGRFAYLTPNMLDVVCRGETFIRLSKQDQKAYKGKPNNLPRELWDLQFMYPSIDDVPNSLLYRWSKPQFHSIWLTRGLGLGTPELAVPLTTAMKMDIK